MKVELVDPFIRALYGALEVLTVGDPVRGPLSMAGISETTQQVTLVFDVDGDVSGMVLCGMSAVTAQKIAYAVLERPVNEMDETSWNALDELGKAMRQSAIQYLQKSGYNCEIEPPRILRGVGQEVSSGIPALVVPVATGIGRMEMNIALKEKALVSA